MQRTKRFKPHVESIAPINQGLPLDSAHQVPIQWVATDTALSRGVADTARAFGISRSLLYKLIKRGEIRTVKIGGRTVILIREALDFLERNGGAA